MDKETSISFIERLNDQEKEVLQCLYFDIPIKEMSKKFKVSTSTINFWIRVIKIKLGTTNKYKIGYLMCQTELMNKLGTITKSLLKDQVKEYKLVNNWSEIKD